MKASHLRPDPARLAEREDSLVGAVLRAAGDLAPTDDAQERIWRHLRDPYPRLVTHTEDEPALAALLRRAAFEPPPGARERIWRRLQEETQARHGVGDPPRLAETIPAVAEAAALEPPFGRRTRILQGLAPVRRPRFVYAAAGLSLAAVAALILLVRTPAPRGAALSVTAGNDLRLLHANGDVPANRLAVGDSVELSGAASARWQLAGVGDCVLDGAQARVTLAANDRHGVRLDLERGRIAIHAVKRSHDAPLVIRSHGVDVEVVGTILAVDSDRDGVQVFVREGRVRVSAPDEAPAFVGAGERWPAASTTPAWAKDDMGTLAGVPVATRAPVPVATHPPVAPADTTGAALAPPAVTKRPILVAQAEPRHSHRTSDTGPAPFEPALAPLPVGAAIRAPEGRRYDLDDQVSAQYGNLTADTIIRAIGSFRAGGADDRYDLALAYRALALAPDATHAQQRDAALALFPLLDDDLAAPADAVDMRRELSGVLDPQDRAESLMSALADLVEMGRNDDALKAAAACIAQCTPEARTFARVLQARLLADAGEPEAAQAAAREALAVDGAYRKTAFYFTQRAERFEASGAHPRAQAAASLSLALDPYGVDATSMRNIVQ